MAPDSDDNPGPAARDRAFARSQRADETFITKVNAIARDVHEERESVTEVHVHPAKPELHSLPARGVLDSMTKGVEKAPPKWRWAIWMGYLTLGCLLLLLLITAVRFGLLPTGVLQP